MKLSLAAYSCILVGIVACAPVGKKLSANTSATGLAPVAAGPDGEGTTEIVAAKAAEVTAAQQGRTVGIYNQGTITVTLDAAQQDGYEWRLSEIPDPTVLKLVSQDFVPPASGTGRGQEKFVFQAVGPGDVKIKMWYGNLRVAPTTGNPEFNFIASVSGSTGPLQKTKLESKPKKQKKPDIAQAF